MKFKWDKGKDKWVLLLLVGVLLLIIAMPVGKSKNQDEVLSPDLLENQKTGEQAVAVAAKAEEGSYELALEQRVKQILKHVEGVGEVDVMIVLKSSEEKVLRVDKNTSSSVTEEVDSGGGTRNITNNELEESTILTGNGSSNTPIVEKELKPEIEGIVISAAGGGSPTVKAEISEAMEALFNIPPHKIKVLKRVE